MPTLRKKKRSQLNNLTLYLNKLVKEGGKKKAHSQQKWGNMKITAEVNEIDQKDKNTSTKLRLGVLRR